ncbi:MULTISPECIES: diguanylate cyclase [unclassified Maridesulfovibrio]|uniref:diguanylate cyclase n=1 Tax=unclassified Maridesulfovibrio TaxID=2794999 RepID=UPI003B425803
MPDKLHEDFLDSVSDGIYILNKQRSITFWSKGAEIISGYSAHDVTGTSCKDNLLRHIDENGVNLCENGCPLEATMNDGKVREANVFMHHKHGHRVLINVKAFPVKDKLGKITGAAEIFKKIDRNSDLIQELELLRQKAMTDPLTGLANRRSIALTVDHFEKLIKCKNHRLGILFVDIDNFKTFNDRFGHHIGDKVLTMVANTIISTLRPTDIASRWGGDEFVIFIPDVEIQELEKLAERLRKLIEQSWINLNNEHISVTASIGGVAVRAKETISSAIKRADEQVYLSKHSGRNIIHIDK